MKIHKFTGRPTLPLNREAAGSLQSALRRELGDLADVKRTTPFEPRSPRRFLLHSSAVVAELTAREARDLLDAIADLLEEERSGPDVDVHIHSDDYAKDLVVYLEEGAAAQQASGRVTVRELQG